MTLNGLLFAILIAVVVVGAALMLFAAIAGRRNSEITKAAEPGGGYVPVGMPSSQLWRGGPPQQVARLDAVTQAPTPEVVPTPDAEPAFPRRMPSGVPPQV